MERLSILLNQPEYVHDAINHLPLIGLLVAMLALVAGLVTRNPVAARIGLALVGLLSLSVWPVYEYGQAGYDRVLSMSDENGQAFLRYHAELAERWVFLYYVTAGVATLGLGLAWKWPRLFLPFSIAALILAVVSFAFGILIAHAGGQIRHREFRHGPPPTVHETKTEKN